LVKEDMSYEEYRVPKDVTHKILLMDMDKVLK